MTTTRSSWNRRIAAWVAWFVVLPAFYTSSTEAQQPCQQINYAAPFPIWGVDSAAGCGCHEVGWDARGVVPWQEFAQGKFVGHARAPHVPESRIREGDVVAVYYRRTRE